MVSSPAKVPVSMRRPVSSGTLPISKANRRSAALIWSNCFSSTPFNWEDQLRAENKRLHMERDILKKATVFFAKEAL